MKLILFFSSMITAFLVSSCRDKPKMVDIDDRIVVVDIRNANRADIAELINQLDLCGAKSIGLYIYFAARLSSPHDSLLVQTIRRVGNVTLVADIEEPEKVQQDIKEAAHKIAFTTRYKDYGKVYSPLMLEYRSQLYESMGTVLSEHYDSLAVIRFIKNGGDLKRPILAEKIYRECYTIIDIEVVKLNCEAINGRIVVVGDLGENESDKLSVNEDQKFIPTILTASEITYLLDFKPDPNFKPIKIK